MANKYLRVAVLCIIVILLFTLGFSYNAMYNEESTKPEGQDPEPRGLMEFQRPLDTESNFTVIDIQMYGERPVVDKDIIVFSTENRPSPSYVYYHNVTLNRTVNTSVQGGHVGLDAPYIVISNSFDAYFYDINTGTSTKFAEHARVSWDSMDNKRIVYVVLEMDDDIDHNRDGDAYDYCGFYYDIETKESTFIAVANRIWISGDHIAGGFNNYLWYYDISTETLHEIDLEASYPGITVSTSNRKLEDGVFAFNVGEGENDLNDNSMTNDFFTAYYDISKKKLNIITEVECSYFTDISERKILLSEYNWTTSSSDFYVYHVDNESLFSFQDHYLYSPNMEGNLIVSLDWNGIGTPEDPPRVGVPNVLLYDTQTHRHINTSIIGFLNYWQGDFSGDIIVISTSEVNAGEDLNDDGDLDDGMIRYILEVKVE